MNFDAFEAEDLLLEESFRNYCLGIDMTDVQFWEEWISQHPARLPVIQQARELYFMMNGNITPDQIKEDKKTFHAKLQQHIGTIPPKKRTPVKRLLLYAGAAAASVILIVWLFWQPAKQTKAIQYTSIHETKAGERKQLQLPDGSKVTLNAGSSLKLAGYFSTATREMELQGEAFFEVAHDAARPFIIHTSAMDIKVLGTVFNVKAYAGDPTTETVLLKGSVEVTLHNAARQKIVLHPSEKIVLANTPAGQPVARDTSVPGKKGSYSIEQLNYHAADSSLAELSWIQNRLEFRSESFARIAKALERGYNVKVVFEDSAIASYRYTARFEKMDIDKVLKLFQLSRPFNYTIDSNKVIHIRK